MYVEGCASLSGSSEGARCVCGGVEWGVPGIVVWVVGWRESDRVDASVLVGGWPTFPGPCVCGGMWRLVPGLGSLLPWWWLRLLLERLWGQ